MSARFTTLERLRGRYVRLGWLHVVVILTLGVLVSVFSYQFFVQEPIRSTAVPPSRPGPRQTIQPPHRPADIQTDPAVVDDTPPQFNAHADDAETDTAVNAVAAPRQTKPQESVASSTQLTTTEISTPPPTLPVRPGKVPVPPQPRNTEAKVGSVISGGGGSGGSRSGGGRASLGGASGGGGSASGQAALASKSDARDIEPGEQAAPTKSQATPSTGQAATSEQDRDPGVQSLGGIGLPLVPLTGKMTIYVTDRDKAGNGLRPVQMVWQSWTARRNPLGQWVYDEAHWRKRIRGNFRQNRRYPETDQLIWLDVEYLDPALVADRAVLKRITEVLAEELPGREFGFFRLFPERALHAVRPGKDPDRRDFHSDRLEQQVADSIRDHVQQHLGYVSPWMFPLLSEEWFRANVRESMRLAVRYNLPIRPSFALSPHPVMVERFNDGDLMNGNWLTPEALERHMQIMYEEGVRELIVCHNAGGVGGWPDELLDVLRQWAER